MLVGFGNRLRIHEKAAKFLFRNIPIYVSPGSLLRSDQWSMRKIISAELRQSYVDPTTSL